MPDKVNRDSNVVGLNSKNRFRSKDVTSADEDCDSFNRLGLSDSLVAALNKAGFEKPSPIQAKAIPLARYGADLIVQAKAGTGKTCVFAVAAFETVDAEIKSPQVIVLAPTREIAIQIQEVINSIGRDLSEVKCRSFIGGLSLKEDINQVKRCQIVVGTPGRVKQLIEERKLDLSGLKMFVLDEADKLLDDKFEKIVNWICSVLPERKQMMALSATYPEQLAKFLQNYMRDPMYVRLDTDSMALLSVKQLVLYVERKEDSKEKDKAVAVFMEKSKAIDDLLKVVAFNQCLVFCNLHAHAEEMSHILKSKGWAVSFIAGSQTQNERIENMRKMKSYEIRVFICTDLISRGIDLEHVDLVINVDIPHDWKTYIHRVGRAGRFGDKGAAFTLCSNKEEFQKVRSIARRCNLDNIMLVDDSVKLPSTLIADETSEFEAQLTTKFKRFTFDIEDQNDISDENTENLAKTKQRSGISNQNDSHITKKSTPEAEVNEQNLTIPKDLFTEMDDLVRMYNSMFTSSVKKVKLNVDEFTFDSFSEHFSHFNETGEFKDRPEWQLVEKVPVKKLQMKNFFKPPSEKVDSKNAISQTDIEKTREVSDVKIQTEETANFQGSNGNFVPASSNFSPVVGKDDQVLNQQATMYHYTYLRSAQHKYMTNMMNLYFGK